MIILRAVASKLFYYTDANSTIMHAGKVASPHTLLQAAIGTGRVLEQVHFQLTLERA